MVQNNMKLYCRLQREKERERKKQKEREREKERERVIETKTYMETIGFLSTSFCLL